MNFEEYVRQVLKSFFVGFNDAMYNFAIERIVAYMQNMKSKEIDNFVEFLIRENCGICQECEPRLTNDWQPDLACVEEGRAKWFVEMAEKYKAESEGKK